MLKVGLVGCGGIGAVHAECWLMKEFDVQLVAIADVSTERAQKYAERSGAKVYTDGKAMIDQEDLDVVDICLPTFLHTEYALYAMQKVKNVIVEKPVCLNEEEAQLLLKMQEKTGALVQVAHVARFGDANNYLKEIVSSGKYGKVLTGWFSRISPKPVWMKGHDDISRTGSMALDIHIHDADFVRYLMGTEPEEVSSWGVRNEEGVIQHIWSSYRFGDALLVAEGSWNYPTNMPFAATYRIRLERAALILDDKGVLTVYPVDGEKFVPEMPPKYIVDVGINVSNLKPYMNEMKYLVEVIKEGNQQGIASLSEAVESCRLVWKELENVGGAKI